MKALHEVDRTTEEYVQQKTALPYQGAGVKVQLAQAELQQVTLQDTIQTQKENLNDLMGRDLTTDFRLNPVPDALPEEGSLELARQNALIGRPKSGRHNSRSTKRCTRGGCRKRSTFPRWGFSTFFFHPSRSRGFPIRCEFARNFVQMGRLRLGL